MSRDGPNQFPPLGDLPRYSDRRFVDPALLDRPVEGKVEVEAPSWLAIAIYAGAAVVIIFMTWSGVLFG